MDKMVRIFKVLVAFPTTCESVLKKKLRVIAVLCACIQIQSGNGEVTITNDGATILKQMQVLHPAARMVRI